MPNASSRSTICRQWELLKALPARAPGATAQELAQALADRGFSVSKRTVERDLDSLSSLFPLQCNDKGTPYGWYWIPGATAELPGLTVGEALTLRIVEDSLRPLLPAFMLKSLSPRFAQARQKLESLGEEIPAARWIERIASVQPQLILQAPEVNGELFERIQHGLLENRQLKCLYFAAHSNKMRELILNPLALIQRGNVIYLAAVVESFSDVRLYAMHRFQQVTLLEAPCQRPEHFRLSDYMASGALQFTDPNSSVLTLEAWVSEDLARQLRETPLGDTMQLEQASGESGGYHLRTLVRDSWELRWWLLSQSGKVVIRAPAALRDAMIRQLQEGLALYRHETATLEPDTVG